MGKKNKNTMRFQLLAKMLIMKLAKWKKFGMVKKAMDK